MSKILNIPQNGIIILLNTIFSSCSVSPPSDTLHLGSDKNSQKFPDKARDFFPVTHRLRQVMVNRDSKAGEIEFKFRKRGFLSNFL